MLDLELIEQLKTVFSRLEKPVTLRMDHSNHGDQASLLELLQGVASASGLIQIEESGQMSENPRFELVYEGKPTGVSFRGVPGGHEFSSLVLAILNSDGKGKLPDAGLLARIQRIKGPIRLRTYISLSCENCPEVVQALNLMALHHSDFRHEMIDGGVAQEEVEDLGIQGVPSVISGDHLIHSGKAQLLDLVTILEATFGQVESEPVPRSLGVFDIVVVGGGPAGASAAIYSVRKGLKTAIVAERFGGQLKETQGIENMISIPYTEGAQLSAQLSDHVGKYPVEIFEHRRVSGISGDASNRRIDLVGGEFIDAKSVIIATGAKWRELGIPGEKEHIGKGVAFCAHCDGPFYKGKRVVVVGGGNSGVEAAIDLAGIATHVTLLEYGEKLRADQVLVEKLQGLSNAKILTNSKSTQVLGENGKVVGIEFTDRLTGHTESLSVDGVFVQIGLEPNSQFLRELVELTPHGEIVVDGKGRTSVPGIYAAGDVTTIPFKQIVTAMGDGAKVALAAFEDRMHSRA